MVEVPVGTDTPFWEQPEALGSCSCCNQGTPRGCPGGVERVALPTPSELTPLCFQVGGQAAAPLCRAFWGSGASVAGLGGGSEDHDRGQPPGANTGQGAAPRGDTALPAGMWAGTGWGTPCPLVTVPPGTKIPSVPLCPLLTSPGCIVLCAATEVASLILPAQRRNLTLPR